MGRINFAAQGGLKSAKRPLAPPPTGVKSFCIGGQVVALKPTAEGGTKKFGIKPRSEAQQWRDMLKPTPPKAKKPKPPKERRESMKEVVLRIERIIRVATRDMLEDYCKEFAKEGLPKKDKPRKTKYKIFEGVHDPAAMKPTPSVGFKESARPCTINVHLNRFESYDSDFTLGNFGNAWHPGIRAHFTARLDYNDPIDESLIQMPEKVFDEETVEANIGIVCEYDSSWEDDD